MRLSLVAVLALVLIACTPAEAAPVIGAIVAAVGLTGTAATIASAVLTIGVGVGLQLLGNVLRPRQKAQPPAGYEADVTLGGDVYQRAIFGRAATKGHLVYINTSGSVNQRLDQVYVVSAGWCDGLDGILLDTESLPLTQVDSGTGWTKYAVTLPDDGGTRRLWATFWDGRPDQASNATLVATANPSGRWTAAHRGRGQAYVHIEADYAASVESFAGLLNGNLLTFVVRGLRLYDLRKDTTAGGSGSHRWDDPSTWEFSEAPAVCLYNFMAGIYVNGQRVIGMGRARYRLLSAQFMAAANVCDETVSVPGGGTEPRYRLSLIVDDSPQYGQAVERMVQAMAGQRIEGPGYHGIQAGAAQVPVATITDADLSATAALSHSNNRSFFDLVNEVWGQFLDPAAGWQPQDYPAVIGDAGMKAADGGATLPSDLDCTQMPSGTQAQRCATIALKRNRHERTARIPVGLKWWRLEPGDWVVWDSARYGTVTFQVVDRTLDTDRHLIFLSLQEVSASIFTAGALTTVPLPPTPPGLPARPTNVSGLTLQTATVEGEGGQAVPALVVGWDPITDETIRSVEVEYRRVGETGAGERRSSTRPASGDWDGITIAGSLMAGTDYEVRVTITTVPIRRTTWSNWQQIETSGEWRVQSAGALYNEATGATVPASDTLGDLRSSIYEQLHRITTEATLAGAQVDTQQRESLRTTARFTETLLLIADETQARVQSTTALEATFTAELSTRATITYVDDAVATEAGARATAITAVQSTVDDLTSDVTVLAEAIDGVEARYGVAVQVGGVVGGFTITGLQPLDGSPVVDFGIQANSFWIVNPANTGQAQRPFLFVDGVLYVNEAVIPTLSANIITAGVLQSANGKVMFDLDNGILRVTS
ncbi:phage tail protein [Stappia sp. WLB 29]|uniref:phage tail protein n=1 Tax=Stappia sp. WLB 29 TaxID=2925220 RepID=UPI0020C10072|nr:phage tail protein [Stappia sp. WLB 29]